MGEKSYVGLGFTVCPFCGKENEANCVLLDMKLQNTLNRRNFLGFKLCEEHEKLAKDNNAICLYAIEHIDDGVQLHDNGMMANIELVQFCCQPEFDMEPGEAIECAVEVYDTLKADAQKEGALKALDPKTNTLETVNA